MATPLSSEGAIRIAPRPVPVRGYATLLTVIVGFGAFLRLHQLDGQIVGDDEWHAVAAAAQRSFGDIATRFEASDYCIPLTLFYKALLETVGLSEWGLHGLPVIVGTASIPAVALAVRTKLGDAVALTFATLIGVSPLLVYYSRYARPYIFVAMLGFIALWALAQWLETRDRRWAAVHGGLVVTLGWFSPVALPGLLAPLCAAFLQSLVAKRGRHSTAVNPGPGPATDEIFALLLLVLVAIAMWLVPALPSFAAVAGKVGQGSIRVATLAGFAELFSGSAHGAVALALLLAMLAGLRPLHRRAPTLARVMLVAVLAQFAALLVLAPYRVFVGVVLARYSILCLPPLLLACATGVVVGFEGASRGAARKITAAIPVAVAAFLFWAGPLPSTLLGTNSFVGHDAFQYHYDHRGLTFSEAAREALPAFYRDLASADRDTSILEYPQVVWWSGTFQHRYQRLHRRRVRMGHPHPTLVLPLQLRHPGLAFANSVDVGAPAEVEASGAHFLVVHRDPANESLFLDHLAHGGDATSFVAPAAGEHAFDRRYGPLSRAAAAETTRRYRARAVPVHYEDRWLTVFDLRATAPVSTAGNVPSEPR